MIVISEKTWGLELKDKTEKEWQIVNDGEEDQKLLIGQAALGVGAKTGERNIVQVSYTDDDGKKHQHILLSLKIGLLEQCALNLGFTSDVRFKLLEGSGPVHLLGTHVTAIPDIGGDEDDLMSDDEEDEDEEEEVARGNKIETVKNTIANAQGSKKRKMVTFDFEESKSGAKKMKLGEMVDEEAEKASDDDDIQEPKEISNITKSPQKQSKIPLTPTKQKKAVVTQGEAKKTPKPAKVKISVDECVKQLLENSQRPKTLPKLTNFLKSKYMISDQPSIDKIWSKVQ